MSSGRPPLPGPRPTVAELGERPRVEHDLKVWPEFFGALEARSKTFEIRRDDRPEGYRVGDVLLLREWDPLVGDYTGRSTLRRIGYIAPLDEIGCSGFVGMSLVLVGAEPLDGRPRRK